MPTVGQSVPLAAQKLREASADLLVKREQYGREVTTTLIGQVAIVGSFLGAFSLLNDSAKAAVVQSKWSVWALAAVALSLCCSLSSYFLIPAKMPSLDQPTALESFWNSRVRGRRRWLIAALGALLAAIGFASAAFADARDEVAVEPAATVSAKFTPAKDTASSLEAKASWAGLETGEYALMCVKSPGGAILGGTVGNAANDGKEEMTLTVPVAKGTKGNVVVETVRLASVPENATTPAKTCTSLKPTRVGAAITSSVRVG